jgi:ElaB/YqjD/DUF883 family membrane-anchored ribosome-binding protein
MASIKPVEKASQDFTAELASLRDDVAKLNSSLSKFIRTRSTAQPNTVFDAVDNAQQKISDTAGKAQDPVARASTDLKTTIEHKPMVAALIAMVAGILVGLLSRGRK